MAASRVSFEDMSSSGCTRIAPTPSGYLHLGNLLNFELTRRVALTLDLELWLRVDDVDSTRLRAEYLQDIQRALDWLGISDIPRAPSQIGRRNYYWDELALMQKRGAPLFVCRCSRPQRVDGKCVLGCDETPSSASRDAMASAVRCRLQGAELSLWVNGNPTYQLVNVIEDRDLSITHVVRGQDLLPSSLFHADLAQFLKAAKTIKYAHHALLRGDSGEKLSKSQGSQRLTFDSSLRDTLDSLVEQELSAVLEQLSA